MCFFSPILCSLSFCRFPLPTTTIFMQCLCMTLDSVEAKHLLNYIFFCASFILQSDICLFLWIMFDCIINLLLSVGLLLLHYTGLRWWCQLLRRWVQALFEKWSWHPWKYRASWAPTRGFWGGGGVISPTTLLGFTPPKTWGLDRNMWESFWQTNVMGRENKYGQMLICNDTKVATFAGAKVSFLCGSAWYVACNRGQNGILWEKVLVLDIFIWIVYFIRLCKWNITTKWHIWLTFCWINSKTSVWFFHSAAQWPLMLNGPRSCNTECPCCYCIGWTPDFENHMCWGWKPIWWPVVQGQEAWTRCLH